MASLSLHQCHLLRPLPLLFLHPDRICYRAPLAELVKHGAQSAASRSQDAAKKKELAALTFPRHEVRSSSFAQKPVLVQGPTLHCFRVVGVGQDVQALFDHHPLCGLLGLHGQLPVEHHCPVHPSHMSHRVQGTDYLSHHPDPISDPITPQACISNQLTPTSSLSLLLFTTTSSKPSAGSDLKFLDRLDVQVGGRY